MRFDLSIPEYSIKKSKVFCSDLFEDNKDFPLLYIDRDSYIEDAKVDSVVDENYIYNIQVGRYTSMAHNISIVIDLNHDYKRGALGRISGVEYERPLLTKRKGEVIICNDCWIGRGVTLLAGVVIHNGAVVAANSVVSKSVPPYAIVAGNPAKIIGYRFEEEQIAALLEIAWWEWDAEKVVKATPLLINNVDAFIDEYIEEARHKKENIRPIDINPIEKLGTGENKIYYYVPDFATDYPTYKRVIEEFVDEYEGTNTELLMYIKADGREDEHLQLLDDIFAKYNDRNTYINLFIGDVEDERSIMCQVDGFITSRCSKNVYRVDIANEYGVKIIAGVDKPIFAETQHMVKAKGEGMPKNRASYDKVKNYDKDIEAITTYMNNMNKVISDMAMQLDTNRTIPEAIYELAKEQALADKTINNLRYELGDSRNKAIVYPKVASIEDTMSAIIDEGKSIARFGDGEFGLICGVNRAKYQTYSEKFGKRLEEVLHSNLDNMVIGIADIYGDLSDYNEQGVNETRAYLSEEVRANHYELLDMNRTYYNTYVTRPYAIYRDNNTDAPRKRFDRMKELWDNKQVVFIEGEKTRLGVGNDLFRNTKSVERIICPAENAFDRYDEILEEALKTDKSKLILIALGAAATVLAYDLAREGYHAVDIGHIDIEYEWMKLGQGKKTSVKGKYNNEIAGGEIVEEIYDADYEKQILARIV